jgi:ribA/ribD-fused uncharacterized protein
MMYRKAMLFGEWDIADQILATDNPAKQKDLGREVKNYDDDKWAAVRFDIMVEGLYEKFNQNPQLKKALLDTVGTKMVEASPFDRIWGIGLADDGTTDLTKPSNWQGLNKLGFEITEVFQELVK